MFARLRIFLKEHPALRDAIVWSIPALLVVALLRLCLLHYIPYAYWGSDSKSYFSFAHKLLDDGYISLDAKRRFFYPILMVPIAGLPGPALIALAWFQHLFGLLTLIPLAYIVRKTFVHWKLWIMPAVLVYGGLPMILWYEHELLGETIFFAMFVWAFAGWTAWIGEKQLARARRLFWWFFVPFALFILTKPSGRFAWPGIALALLALWAWPKLSRIQWGALGALVVATLFVGSRSQAAWLLYVAVFPLTQLDTPKYAEYKAEIRDLVEPLRKNIDVYYIMDEGPFEFLEIPDRVPGKPLWHALRRDEKLRNKIYTTLALEGIRAEPGLFVYMAWQRILVSMNLSEFKEDRFIGDFYQERLQHHYEEARAADAKGKATPFHMLFGFSRQHPMPTYEEFKPRLSPDPDGWQVHFVRGWVAAFERYGDFAILPEHRDETQRQLWKAKPTVLGWLLLISLPLAFLPRYRPQVGAWVLIGGMYLLGIFIVGQPNPRYTGPAWVAVVVAMFVPLDLLLRLLFRRKAAATP